MLTPQERLEYCKFCENGHKTESGEWLCKLTMQEPFFDCICYDYKETQARAHLRRENEEAEIRWYNEGVDYSQLNWDDLEPEKEIPFCPDKKEIVQGQYVNKEIVAVPINDVRWWVIDKIPDIDLSKHLKIIVRNSYWHMHFSHWSFLGAVSIVLFLFFYACYFSLNFSLLLALLSGVCISLVGYFKDIKSGRTKHSCVEINRLDGFIKLPDDRFRYVIPFENVYFHLIGRGNVRSKTRIYLAMILPSKIGNTIDSIPFLDRYYENKIIEALSIFVWYMDKNRPLPPGTEFDKFRQKDFERRKAEGFPPPMYLSHILTPEATAEQQAERETYWKDEDYKVTDMTTRDIIFTNYEDRGFKIPYSHLQEVWTKRKKSIIPDWMK